MQTSKLSKQHTARESKRKRLDALRAPKGERVDWAADLKQRSPIAVAVLNNMKVSRATRVSKTPGYSAKDVELLILINGVSMIREDFNSLLGKLVSSGVKQKLKKIGFSSVQDFLTYRQNLLTQKGREMAEKLLDSEVSLATRKELGIVMDARFEQAMKAFESLNLLGTAAHAMSENAFDEVSCKRALRAIEDTLMKGHLTPEDQRKLLVETRTALNAR